MVVGVVVLVVSLGDVRGWLVGWLVDGRGGCGGVGGVGVGG